MRAIDFLLSLCFAPVLWYNTNQGIYRYIIFICFDEKIAEQVQGLQGVLVRVKRKVLLIIPHQDDELFVGGGLLKSFAQSREYDVYVVFTTNGDFFPGEGEVRLTESLHVLTQLYTIEEAHIFFLGYGDGWKSDRHLYNHNGSRIVESEAGRRETYGTDGHEDYRYIKSGRHSTYCRDNFKCDLKGVISDLTADIIIAVDYDKHPDHKAASLMTEECIGELLKEKSDYHPLVLKRYAYDGVWKGKADFFDMPRKRTSLSQKEHSPYGEEERICIAMPPECSTPLLGRNFLYAALKCYRTQEIWKKADEIINIDEVYFKRNTNNLLYSAQLEASSGNAEYIRDFKLFDCGDVLQKELVIAECAWIPDAYDSTRKIHIHFTAPRTIEQINIYALGNSERDILEGEFVFDSGMRLATGNLCLNGTKNPFTFHAQRDVRDIDFCLINCTGSPQGITEMEILSSCDRTIPEELQPLLFQGDTLEDTVYNRIVMKVEKLFFMLKRKASWWVPNEYSLKRQYPELRDKSALISFYRIKYILDRIRSKRSKSI